MDGRINAAVAIRWRGFDLSVMAITGMRLDLCHAGTSCPNSLEGTAMTTAHDGLREFGTKRLDKRLVHKSHEENVLISRVEALQAPIDSKHEQDSAFGRTDHFRAFLCREGAY